MAQYPRGEKGKSDWDNIVNQIKKRGQNKRYDCVIGVSGGTDSCYLLHIVKEYGLRPLAVNLDNGWNSDIAVSNIKLITNALNIDLETYVIDYEEVKRVLKAYMYAGLPWIDSPTDQAIKSTLYKIAAKEGIKFVLNGSDFRTEGKQPLEWTYSDGRQLEYVVSKYAPGKLKSYPYLPMSAYAIYGYLKGIQVIRPLYFLPYKKSTARALLESKYGWKYYGGHHHENVFTKFAISYWMPRKFGMDKRIITLSAQVLSGEITRDDALDEISKPPYDPQQMELDRLYVVKKLDLDEMEFQKIWNTPNRSFHDYPSYYPLLKRYKNIIALFSDKIFSFRPGTLEQV